MNSSDTSCAVPMWFRLVCCGTPMMALLIATVGLAVGSTFSPIIFAALAMLCWRVIGRVLGVEGAPIVLNIAGRRLEASDERRFRKVS